MDSVYSGPLKRLLTISSQETMFSTNPVVRKQFPGTAPFEDEIGIIGTDDGQHIKSGAVRLVPMCAGPADSPFWMMVSSWHKVIHESSGANQILWVRQPVAVFACVAGELPGPMLTYQQALQGKFDDRGMESHMNLCDEIVAVNGTLGQYDKVVSYGPGWNEAAYVELMIPSRVWQIQFACPDFPGAPMEMNAFLMSI